MKKQLLPVIVVVCLIFIVAGAGAVSFVVNKYSPSKERMDGNEYFQLTSEEEAALVVNQEIVEEKVKIIDGRYYVEDAVVGKYINSRFYWDEQQKVMLYTLPLEVVELHPDVKEYQTSEGVQTTEFVILKSVGDSYYLDWEFIQMFSDMESAVYEEPNRIVIRTDIGESTVVTVTEAGSIRQKGGIKSVIVTDAEKEEQLYLLEEMDNWSKVATQDGYTGYIEKDKLSDPEVVTFASASTLPEYTSMKKDYKINMAWHQVTSQEGNDLLSSVLSETQGLNTISPTWFSVIDNNGTISSLASAEYVNQAHGMGLEVWALIDNFSTSANTLTFLSNRQARTNIIQQLMAQADAVGFDGVNLDFESITEEQAPHYVQFIRELSVACRQKGLVFSIDVPVPTYTAYYNRTEMGIVADYVIIMGYDEHYGGGDVAGSVASIDFVRNGIIDTLEEVPANKVINAIPFYTRVWREPYGGGNLTSDVLGMNGCSTYIAEKGMDVYWDTSVGQNVASLEGDDALYTIWVEDEQSIEEKMKLVPEYGLAGVSAWKLGFERESVWPVISQYLN